MSKEQDIQMLNKIIDEKDKYIEQMNECNKKNQKLYDDSLQENMKLKLRLDACLYSMVMMQAVIRETVKNTNKDSLALAT